MTSAPAPFVGDWTVPLARLFPENEAVLDLSTQVRVTYRELSARVDSTARALVKLGITRGDRVLVLAKNRIEHVDLLFACARLGALYVPINWRLAEPELKFIVDDTEARVLFYDAAFAYAAGRVTSKTGTVAVPLDAAAAGDDSALPLSACHANVGPRDLAPLQVAVSLDDPWIVLYTSGTTGTPKGALLPFRQVAFNALNTIVALDLVEKDRTVTYTPFFHTGALHVLTTPLFAKGGSIVITEGFDADRILHLCAEERCTLMFGVPTTFERMASSPLFESVDLSRVRLALCGGAPCPISLIERYASRGIVFKQGYGLTEVGPNVLNLRGEDAIRKKGSAGQPNLMIWAEIRDDQGQTVHGPGRGELCLGGPCACLGYWRRPDATYAAFTEDGLFKTGDVVERDVEGFFTIVDRKKDMFISGGENVYPAEVEKVLTDHPLIRACAVIGLPDAKWGEVGCAYLEVEGAASLDETALKTWLKERLAAYKIPKSFIVVRELPRNPSGKVQKHLLREAA
jgi:fatty-acyl-CoA synthase